MFAKSLTIYSSLIYFLKSFLCPIILNLSPWIIQMYMLLFSLCKNSIHLLILIIIRIFIYKIIKLFVLTGRFLVIIIIIIIIIILIITIIIIILLLLLLLLLLLFSYLWQVNNIKWSTLLLSDNNKLLLWILLL